MVLIKSILAGLASVAVVAAQSSVLDLIPSNFDEIAIGGKPALGSFWGSCFYLRSQTDLQISRVLCSMVWSLVSPILWCLFCKIYRLTWHSKTLAPIYEELATAFAGSKSKVVIAKVDADREKTLGKRFGVQGFPTLKWFDGKSDKPEDYNGGRDLESLSYVLYALLLVEQTRLIISQGIHHKKDWHSPKEGQSSPKRSWDVDRYNIQDTDWRGQGCHCCVYRFVNSPIYTRAILLIYQIAPWCGHCKT